MPIIDDQSAITLREIRDYLRKDRGHSKRAAKEISKDVLNFEEVSRQEMPSGWHEILYPPKTGFVRRTGWDPFNYGSGTQIIRGQENGPDAMSPNVRIEAV